ncbi:MAG: nucleoside hydrolase [Chloroflexi bacterium]|nr:nucleoside hydrolase [Chloroflexota bacterium]
MRLLIDTDAGVDDAQAIMLALAHPGVMVEAITTVTGNVHVEQVNRNVFTVLDLLGADIPVYSGAEGPLLPGFWEPEVRVHGADGLGDYAPRLPVTRQVEAEHAALALVRLADAAPGELTCVALGPLTNIALACKLDPEFPLKLKALAFMGGTLAARGNTRYVTAEFNVNCDPEAALIVLAAFETATMLSWETTWAHGFTWDAYDTLAAIDTPAGYFFRTITRAVTTYFRNTGLREFFLLPDPLAMAVTLQPGLVLASEFRYVTVELQGQYTRGQTVIDYPDKLDRAPNTHLVTRVDTAGVYALFERMLCQGR